MLGIVNSMRINKDFGLNGELFQWQKKKTKKEIV